MQTLNERMAALGITATIKEGYDGPIPDGMSSHMVNSWTVRFTRKVDGKRRVLTTGFFGGSAVESIAAEDVMDSMLSDSAGFENAGGFEDWAGDYGYDTDSRKAERVYQTVKTQARKLRQFLGDDYDTLLWETERL